MSIFIKFQGYLFNGFKSLTITITITTFCMDLQVLKSSCQSTIVSDTFWNWYFVVPQSNHPLLLLYYESFICNFSDCTEMVSSVCQCERLLHKKVNKYTLLITPFIMKDNRHTVLSKWSLKTKYNEEYKVTGKSYVCVWMCYLYVIYTTWVNVMR